jgi:hypothetical protein
MKKLVVAVLIVAAGLLVGTPVIYIIGIDLRVDNLRGAMRTVNTGYAIEMADGSNLEVVKQEARTLYFRPPTPPLAWGESLWQIDDLRDQIVKISNSNGQVVWTPASP